MALGVPFVLPNNIDLAAFRQRFPDDFVIKNIDPWEMHALGLAPDRSWFRYMKQFSYISDRFGPVVMPEGAVSDLASTPPKTQFYIANDAPCIMLASGPHDKVCTQAADGTRGWTGTGAVRLSFASANDLIVEAMFYLGASAEQRAAVHAAVTWGNLGAKKDFPLHDIL